MATNYWAKEKTFITPIMIGREAGLFTNYEGSYDMPRKKKSLPTPTAPSTPTARSLLDFKLTEEEHILVPHILRDASPDPGKLSIPISFPEVFKKRMPHFRNWFGYPMKDL